MAPKRATQPAAAATRRSTRIASKAGSSRASSVALEEKDSAKFGISKPNAQQKAALKHSLPFNSIAAIERLVGGDRAYLQQLTQSQKDAVISSFIYRELDFQRQISELKREVNDVRLENQELSMRSKPTSNPLRDTFLAARIAKFQREAATHTPAASKIASRTSTPAAAKPDLSEQTDFDFSQTSVIEGTPAVALAPQTETPPAETPQSETPQRRSFFGSFFRSITSPFSSRKNAAPTPGAAIQTEQPKLGELPASRKRPAPEPESEPEPEPEPARRPRRRQPEPEAQVPRFTISETPKRAQAPQATSNAFTAPRTAERSLTTITEHTEPSEQGITVPKSTPSRQPRRIRDTIRRSTARCATPSRAWTPQPAPRDPNADRRIEKLRRYKELAERLSAMKNDPETKEIIERPLKRVKIDDLVSIPHNRPGDAKSTFRMFEIDSDDEMEVDSEVEIRSNVFESPGENETLKVPEVLPNSIENRPIAETPQAVAKKPENVYDFKWTVTGNETSVEMIRPNNDNETFKWPTLAPRTTPRLEGRQAMMASAGFAYAMATWEATGQIPASLV